MKIKLLLLFVAIACTSYSQTINNFNSALGSIYIVIEDATLDQSPSGASATWTFNSLVATGNINADTFAPPTSGELVTYPGTTEVLSITSSTGNVNQVFIKNVASQVSITGATGDAFDLNYNTDNALIGTFSFEFMAPPISDPVAGTIIVSGFIGTFSGTIDTNVDGYGTLIMNDVGAGTFTGNVTRLKTVQNVNIVIGPFLGTITQTSYNYYADNGDLVFRTTDVVIDVPPLISNQTASTKESLLTSVLATTRDRFVYNNLKIAPNPVGEQLHIKMNSSDTIKSIFITDMTGRVVLKVDGINASFQVSHLIPGIYFATITTDNGTTTRKFIKK